MNEHVRNPAPLLSVLRGLLPTLPTGPATVARHIVDHPGEVAGMSLGQLARATATSESTVTRLATAAGFRGYRDLRIQVAVAAGAITREDPDDGQLTSDISQDDPADQTVAKLAAEECSAITDTAATLDPQAVREAATALAGARRIVVIGIAASGLVALDLAGKLSRIGLVAQAVTEGHEALTTALVLQPGDALVMVSSSGGTTDVVEPLEVALAHQVTTVALTARAGSAVTRADHVLLSVSSRESELRPAAMASRTGQMFLGDVLFTMVAQLCFEQARSAVRESWLALRPRHGAARPHADDASRPTGQEDR